MPLGSAGTQLAAATLLGALKHIWLGCSLGWNQGQNPPKQGSQHGQEAGQEPVLGAVPSLSWELS